MRSKLHSQASSIIRALGLSQLISPVHYNILFNVITALILHRGRRKACTLTLNPGAKVPTKQPKRSGSGAKFRANVVGKLKKGGRQGRFRGILAGA